MAPERRAEQLTGEVATRVADALQRPRWSSPDPVLWAMMSTRNAASHRLVVRWGMAVAVASYVSYGIFDFFLFPDVAILLISTRFGLGMAFMMMLEIAVRRNASTPALHYIAATALVAGSVGWLLIAIHTAYQDQLSYFIIFGIISI